MIERESKSWTWVNERPCAECGFDASATPATETSTLLRDAAETWSQILTAHDLDRLVTRPDPSTWSVLEYACHVRDVLALLDLRYRRVLTEDRPTFEDWHPNDRADAGHYADERDPAAVATAISATADLVATCADAMTADQWQRRGTRADGLDFTLAFLATYLTHDVVHHVHDARRILG